MPTPTPSSGSLNADQEPISDSADDPLKATRELVRQIGSNPVMRAAVAAALKAMQWQPGDKLPPD